MWLIDLLFGRRKPAYEEELFACVLKDLRAGKRVMVYGDTKGSTERFVGWLARDGIDAPSIGRRVYLWGGIAHFDEGRSGTWRAGFTR
ncbi:MAG: hypothetical protein IT349_19375 [Candidatus Eisenbacteria bacterium]|nr:hypothetical protein [Candidatus Eisenbacteria bacterium]